MYLNLEEKQQNKILAIDMKGNRITYGETISIMNEIGNKLSTRKLAFILCENDVMTLECYLACMEYRIVPLLLGHKIDNDLLDQLVNLYHPYYFFGMSDDIQQKNIHFEQSISIEFLNERGYICGITGLESYPLYPHLSLLLSTSGSTGSPKLVRHSYDNIEIQAKNVATFFEMDGHERPLCDLPMEYTMGLSVVNSYLFAGATLLLAHEGITSKNYWKFFREEEATGFIGVPYSYELLKKLRFTNMDFPSLELLSQGGGKLPRELNKEFVEYITKKGGRFIATYGQTEGSARMTYLPKEYATTKYGSIGIAIPQGKLYLKTDDGEIIKEPFVEGEMYYEGPNVTLGYAVSGEDLIKGDERHGVLPTGDIAYFDEDGCFYIVGRIKRFLKLFGYRVNLDECEKIVREKFNIECACTGDDKMLLLYITVPNMEDEVKQYLVSKTRLYANSVTVKLIDVIPRSSAGKILYSALSLER